MDSMRVSTLRSFVSLVCCVLSSDGFLELTFAIALARVGLGAVLMAPNSLCILSYFSEIFKTCRLGRFRDFECCGAKRAFFPGGCTCLLMT